MELTLNEKRENITSLELLEKINQFREEVEGKNELQHKDLLKVIRDEFEEEIGEGKFSPTYYKDSWNREQPMFILTFNQAKQVLVRENKKVRKMVIEYIEKLENALKNQFSLPGTYKEALLQLIKQEEEKEELLLINKNLEGEIEIKNQLIGELEPAKDYLDCILASEDTMKITQIAGDYGLSAQALNKILSEEGIIRKVNGQWILYIKHMNKGYTKSNTFKVREDKTVIETVWTQKGRLMIHEILKSLGYKANMDKEVG
ncbi:phage antirepressor KilAC domain-containing protein [Streptobacillus canis]|uniref:phage antirepressor KilAC domain-containing protein n=1 Tax=Streptobacillus canis TaxID=2678686 RepID=UPI0012E0E8B5|nr:phage antirepressor KilAC domain-containing protein [Streptobacillus canis]